MKKIIATLFSLFACSTATANAGHRLLHRIQVGLDKRQITQVCGVGDTCEKACGKGWRTCWGGDYCFNPSAGDTCCADGSGIACDSSCYCVKTHDGGAGCCPVGDTLAQCHASMSIAPVATDATLASFATGISSSAVASSSSSSSGAEITRAAMVWEAEALGLAAVGLGAAFF